LKRFVPGFVAGLVLGLALGVWLTATVKSDRVRDMVVSRSGVVGTVTYRGLPLREGVIEFVPARGDGVASTALIYDGKFSLDQGSGLQSGSYQVRISGVIEEKGAMTPVPGKYGQNSPLALEVPTFGDRVTADFTLD
jgi:hypothetical protein